MEVVNNMVSETPVLEGAALEELKALLDLQTKMFIEAMDKLFDEQDAKWDARVAQSGARTSGGSGVLDAAVAQEVTPDLDLAADATSTTDAEPSDINTGALAKCSTKFPNLVVDASMPVPMCTVTEEVIPNSDHVAGATSAIYVEPCDGDIGTFTKCSTKCPSHGIEVTASAVMYAATEEPFVDLVLAAATSNINSGIGVALSDEPDTATTMSGHNYTATFDSASSKVDVLMPANCLTKRSGCDVDAVLAPDLAATNCLTKHGEESMVYLYPLYLKRLEHQPWSPPLLLETTQDSPVLQAVLCPSYYCEDKGQHSWPTLSACLMTGDIAKLRPIPWPSFISSVDCSTSWSCSFVWKPPWPLQFRQNIRSVPPTILHELLKCIRVSSVCGGCAEVELTSGDKWELHLVAELIFGADEIYIQSSRGVVVMLSGLRWLLEHSIDLFKKMVELILWSLATLMHVLGIGFQLRPMPWPYFICGQSLGVFMLKSESPSGLLTTEAGICVVISVLTTWARTKGTSSSSHGAWELFFSTTTSYSEKLSFLSHNSASCFGIGNYVGNIVFFSYDDAKTEGKQPVKICCKCIQKQLSSVDMHIILWVCALLTEIHSTSTSSLFSRMFLCHCKPLQSFVGTMILTEVLQMENRKVGDVRQSKQEGQDTSLSFTWKHGNSFSQGCGLYSYNGIVVPWLHRCSMIQRELLNVRLRASWTLRRGEYQGPNQLVIRVVGCLEQACPGPSKEQWTTRGSEQHTHGHRSIIRNQLRTPLSGYCSSSSDSPSMYP